MYYLPFTSLMSVLKPVNQSINMWMQGHRAPMAPCEQEYVIAPWGTGNCETKALTVELPSRELVAQLEVPTDFLDRLARQSAKRGMALEELLAERLEINRARTSLMTAKAADEMSEVQKHLKEARHYLSGVEEHGTGEIEAEIESVWRSELDSA
jgi:glycine/D-amino acid oxidase-like deaminating enzyme